MNTNFEEIFQGWLEKEEYNKNKGFLKKSKYWKKYFCVLRRYEGDSNVYLQWFEREEEWRKEFPKGSFGLFPKYAVYKHKAEKGKPYFEISNDEEAHYFLANNEMTMDLWVIQLMMQTTLSSSMIENSFRVKGGENKHLQRIGAKNLNCLLHISEWGITLALERTHSVLSQWPLTTIRNYECSDNNEFVFEAGRKSPMGEGKYEFLTTNAEDNAIFDQLDHYASIRASRVRSAGGGRNRLNSANDEEIAQAYGQLRWSVMLTRSQLNLGVIQAMPSLPQAIRQNNNQVYCRLDRQATIQTSNSVVEDSYNRLDRAGSLSDRLSLERSYSRLNCNNTVPVPDGTQSQRSMRDLNIRDSYDHLERTPTFTGSPSGVDNRSRSFGSLEGQAPFRFPSPTDEESYNHLSRLRHASLPSSISPQKQMDFYDKLDRSMASVSQGSQAMSYDRLDSMRDQGLHMNSYDRLDSMQGSILLDRDPGISPPPYTNDQNAFDSFGNHRAHVPTSYPLVNLGEEAQDQEPLVVELPPPLPKKPSSLKSKGELKSNNEAPTSPPVLSPKKRNKPLPPRPDLNGQDTTEKQQTSDQSVSDKNDSKQENDTDAPKNENLDSHYQFVDDQKLEAVNGHYQKIDEEKLESDNDPTKTEMNGSHYQSIDNKEELKYDEPRGRLNTHSSNPDLTKIPVATGTLDRSKRSTVHRSAPSLALYSTVNKKSKGSPKLSKSASTFKLFKRFGRSSKKEEESYEKIPRKSRKSKKKENKVQSTSTLKPFVTQEEGASYVDIDGEESALAKSLMDRRDSKRPLPDLPSQSSIDV